MLRAWSIHIGRRAWRKPSGAIRLEKRIVPATAHFLRLPSCLTREPLCVDHPQSEDGGLALHLMSRTQDAKPSMIERQYFDQTRLTDKLQENFLTYNEVFTLLEPYATIPSQGNPSVQTLQQQFRATPYEGIFQAVPKGANLAVSTLYEQLDELIEAEGMVYVHNRKVYREKDGDLWRNNQYYMDWQGQAIAYRLATQQLVPGIPVADLDRFGVLFTPSMTNSNQLELKQGRRDFIYDPFEPNGNHNLMIEVEQRRLFERNGTGSWHERGALTFLEVTEMVPWFNKKRQRYDTEPARATRILLNRQPFPGEYFDTRKTLISQGGESWESIAAPMPNLQPPTDVYIKL